MLGVARGGSGSSPLLRLLLLRLLLHWNHSLLVHLLWHHARLLLGLNHLLLWLLHHHLLLLATHYHGLSSLCHHHLLLSTMLLLLLLLLLHKHLLPLLHHLLLLLSQLGFFLSSQLIQINCSLLWIHILQYNSLLLSQLNGVSL